MILNNKENIMQDYIEIPIEQAVIPSTGKVWVDRYWLTIDNCVLFYNPRSSSIMKLSSPQCNNDRVVVETIKIENILSTEQQTIKKIPAIYESSCRRYLHILNKMNS